ncbi:MAG: hypothetical protein ACK559_37505 [bacterium]
MKFVATAGSTCWTIFSKPQIPIRFTIMALKCAS